MFTGLTEALADVVAIQDKPPGKLLTIAAPTFRSPAPSGGAKTKSDDVKLGDSIAINGCCLTVVHIEGDLLSFEAGQETLQRTNLGQLVAGQSVVNLERALSLGDRLGGHYVTGHVDATGRLIDRIDDPPWSHLKFSIPPEFAVQVVAKGSITVDGISLTVVEAGDEFFTVALIPHTLAMTTLGNCRVGDTVNLETDILAKYVQRSLQPRSPNASTSKETLRSERLDPTNR